jgi:transcription elongation factor SPT5
MGGWVRVKRGKYTGDLGQVLELSDAQDTALIKLVPRLDLDSHREKDEYGQTKKKSAGAPSAASRPPQKMFNPERLDKHTISSLQKKGPYWVFNGDHFRDGYLEKRTKVATLQVANVNPSLDEIARFAGDNELNPEDGERTLDLATLTTQSANDVQASSLFQNGDTVEVIEGDLIRSTGTVVSVSDSSVMVSLNVEGFKKQVSFPPRQIRKQFNEGDHVKVIHGRYKDESGMIVNVKENIVTILSDATLKEVKVFAKDLREAMDVSFGKTTIGNYELHDLVQLE